MTCNERVASHVIKLSAVYLAVLSLSQSVSADNSLWGVQPLPDRDYGTSGEGPTGHYNPWQLPPSSFTPADTFTNSGGTSSTSEQPRAPWGWQFGQAPKTPEQPAYIPGYESLPGYTGGKRSSSYPSEISPGYYYEGEPQPYAYPNAYPESYQQPVVPPYWNQQDPTYVSPYLDRYPDYGVPPAAFPSSGDYQY